MRILIDNDLVYSRDIALQPEAIALLKDYFENLKEVNVWHSLNVQETRFEIVVKAQKITLAEEDMAVVHEILQFFWKTQLTLFDFGSSGYSFKLTSQGEQDIDFNVSKES